MLMFRNPILTPPVLAILQNNRVNAIIWIALWQLTLME
jgi:hypothetical protein